MPHEKPCCFKNTLKLLGMEPTAPIMVEIIIIIAIIIINLFRVFLHQL